ncbi:hypothetical protein DIPPA_04803 [Diplonema papillatum]|nr:hypothetical protein DIPPA_04803 [Diplonema papillatum]|eukprot:gene9299-14408_t
MDWVVRKSANGVKTIERAVVIGDEDVADLEDAQRRELEPCEDELGAVVWNSVDAAQEVLLTQLRACFLAAHHPDTKRRAPRARPDVPPFTILELGAGTGAQGLQLYASLRALLPVRYIATDMPCLMPLLRYNVEVMNPEFAPSFDLFPLAWGKPLPSEVASRAPFDAILVVDGVYGNPETWPLLMATLRGAMGKKTTCYNVCEQRVPDVEVGFLDMLESSGSFDVERQWGDAAKAPNRLQSELGHEVRLTCITLR